MKDYTIELVLGLDAEREGHVEFIAGELINFLERMYPANSKDWKFVIYDDRAKPVLELSNYVYSR